MKYKKVATDMIISIIASCIPVVVNQLVILPMMAKQVNAIQYGLAITIMTLYSTFSEAFGGALNNIRLIKNVDYSKTKNAGDFTTILFLFEICSLVLSLAGFFVFVREIDFLTIACFIYVCMTTLCKDYYQVEYRLLINYKKILYSNIALTVGYLLGYLCFSLTNQWQMIFVIGNTLQLVYTFLTTKIYKEKRGKSILFRDTLRQTWLLLISTILFKLITYADKFIIFPILGGEATSIYYVSTLAGKMVSLLIGPIAGVMLTYLGKEDKKNNKLFLNTLLIGLALSFIGYILCVLCSKPILTILYPEYVQEALKYILITTGTAALSALISLLNPFVMRFYDMKWQIIINGASAGIYILLCIYMANKFGLFGVCYASLISTLLRNLVTIWIYFKKGERKSIQ